MRSPYFWLNIAVIVVLLANLALAVQMARVTGRASASRRLSWRILLRASSILYVVLSALIFAVAAQFVYTMEFCDRADTSWQRNQKWRMLRVGMTPAEVIALLGQPCQQTTLGSNDELQFEYELHPYDRISEGFIKFSVNGTPPSRGLQLRQMSPENANGQQALNAWLPEYARPKVANEAIETTARLAFISMLALALISIFPWGVHRGWLSWAVYTPLIAMVLIFLYEKFHLPGWRFESLVLYPAYFLILVAWCIRIYTISHRRPEAAKTVS